MEPTPTFAWNAKPKNGQKAFFTESSYSRWLGEESHETRLAQGLKKIGIALPTLPGVNTQVTAITQQQQQQHNVGRAGDKNDGRHNARLNQDETSSGMSDKPASLSYADSNHADISDKSKNIGHIKLLDEQSEEVNRNKSATISSDIDVSQVKIKQNCTSESLSNKPECTPLPQNEMVFKSENEDCSNEGLYASSGPCSVQDQTNTNVEMETDTIQWPVTDTKKEPVTDTKKESAVPHKVSEPTRHSAPISPFSAFEEKMVPSSSGEEQWIDKSSMIYNIDRTSRHIPLISKKRPLYKRSKFSQQEQKLYLDLQRKYGKGLPAQPTPAQEDEIKRLEVLSKDVKEEQKRFQSYLRFVSSQCKEDYLYIHSEADKYVKEKLLSRRQRVLQCPRYYNVKEQMILTESQQTDNSPNLNYVRPLLELGNVSWMVLPALIPGHPQPCTPISHKQVTGVCPSIKPWYGGTRIWNREECSRDVNAEQLAVPNKCDVVLSSCSLKYLMDTQDRRPQLWDIPFTVREYDVMEGDKKVTHKVVYIDKPLTRQSTYTVKDKNRMFQKSALLATSLRKKQKSKAHVFSNIKPSVWNEKAKTYEELQQDNDDLEQSWDIPMEDMSSSDTEFSENSSEEDYGSPNKKRKKKKKQNNNKKKVTQMGVFDVKQDIDELETFGADLKLMSKSSDGTKSGPKQKISLELEMELLKNELKGIKEKAKKDINPPAVKQLMPLVADKKDVNSPEVKQHTPVIADKRDINTTEVKQPTPFVADKDKYVALKNQNLMEMEKIDNTGTESVDAASSNVDPEVENNASEKDMLECSDSVPVEYTNTEEDIDDSHVEKDIKDSNIEKEQSVLKPKSVAKKLSSSLSIKMKQMSEITSKLKLRSLQKQNSIDESKQHGPIESYPKAIIISKNSPEKPSMESDLDSEDEGLVMDVPCVPKPAEVVDAPASPDALDAPASPDMLDAPASPDGGPLSPTGEQPNSPNQSITTDNETVFGGNNMRDTCVVIPWDDEENDCIVRDYSSLKSETAQENNMLTTSEKDVENHPVEVGNSVQNDCKSMEVETEILVKELEPTNQELSGVKTRGSKRRSKDCVAEDATQNKRALRFSTASSDESLDSSSNLPRRTRRYSSLDINNSKLLGVMSEQNGSSPERKIDVVSERITRSRSTSAEKTDVKCETTGKRVTRQSSGIMDGSEQQGVSTSLSMTGSRRITRRSLEQTDSPAVDGGTCLGLSETRGMKRTSTDSLTDVNPLETITVKRKRGRPPKKKIAEKNSEISQPVEEETDNLDTAKIDEISHEQKVQNDENSQDSNSGIRKLDEANINEADVKAEDSQLDNDDTIIQTKLDIGSDHKGEQVKGTINNPKVMTRTMSTRRSRGMDYKEIETDERISGSIKDRIRAEHEGSVKDRIRAEHEGSVVEKDVEISLPRKRGRPPSSKKVNTELLQKTETTKIRQMVDAMKHRIAEKSASQTEKSACQIEKSTSQTECFVKAASDTRNAKYSEEDSGVQSSDSNRNTKDLQSVKSVKNAENVVNLENSAMGTKNAENTHTENSARGTSSAACSKRSTKPADGLGIDNILSMQSQMFKPASYTGNANNTNERFAAQHHMSQIAFPAEGNITYHQWSLGDIGIVIRCRYHGHSNPQGLVYVSPKMEYQPYFGFERQTLREVARNWISIYTRPNSSLVRARINPFNSEVMMMEHVQYPDLIPPECPFSPAKAFADLQQVLQKMKQLPAGQYLLKNNFTKNRRLTIMQATNDNERGRYDLHYCHSSLPKGEPPFPIQWRPIDTQLLLQHHKRKNLIPCTYSPHDAVFGNQKKGKKKQGKKKGKQQA